MNLFTSYWKCRIKEFKKFTVYSYKLKFSRNNLWKIKFQNFIEKGIPTAICFILLILLVSFMSLNPILRKDLIQIWNSSSSFPPILDEWCTQWTGENTRKVGNNGQKQEKEKEKGKLEINKGRKKREKL